MENKLSKKRKILDIIFDFFQNSHDFNGIPASKITEIIDISMQELKDLLLELIEENQIGILYSSTDINTHIIRRGFEPLDIQIQKLSELNEHTCIYPSKELLSQTIDKNDYAGTPYKLDLALGEPHLSYKAFDLSILEIYRNDPRYDFRNDDIRGDITVSTDFYDSDQMAARDQVFIKSFGFAYNEDKERAVAVFTKYLSNLSPEHQQLWKSKELAGNYRLHPDYYQNNLLGSWGSGITIFDAVLMEIQTINKYALAMKNVCFFKEEFDLDNRPLGFSFLIRPTSKEFLDFIHVLDKILSENINKQFFKGEIDFEFEEIRKDGKIQVYQKNTITLFKDWIYKFFNAKDEKPIEEVIKTLRHVRSLRQKPAHKLNDNKFDQKYIIQQRELISRVYEALRIIRLIFANHPNCKDIKPPDILENSEIWIE